MKKFFIELGQSIIVSLVIVPLTLAGLGIGGLILEKVEPFIRKKLKLDD